ncbi:MAG: GTP-binding protein [Fusobacteriaceae bacterium]
MEKIKLFIILGFLGSGKTTFLKRYLENKIQVEKTAIVINEFGQIGVDGTSFQGGKYELKEISNGSIFCSCKSDKFFDTLVELFKMGYYDIIVESSGLSNPVTINKVVKYLEEKTNTLVDLTTVGIADAKSIYKLINTNIIIKQQIIASDIILLNKIDIASKEEIKKSYQEILKYNKNSKIIECNHCDFDIREISFKKVEKNFLVNTKILGNKKLSIEIFKIISIKELEKWLKFYKDVFRIKGYINAVEGCYHIEGTVSGLEITKETKEIEKSFLTLLYSKNFDIDKIMEELKELTQNNVKYY